jgi:predicted transcriptional regulator
MPSNNEDEEIYRVLFELSNDRRASILFEVEKNNLKMQQIARSLDMTVTETFRHLQRLSDSKLVEKKVDGTYAITSLGILANSFMSSFNFILKNADFFIEHDVVSIPYEFVNRLCELSDGEFYRDALSAMNKTRKMVDEAENYIWAIAEQSESSHTPIVNEKMHKGLKLRFIMQKELARVLKFDPKVEHLKERKFMERVPVTLLITEKEAVVHLRMNNGRMDYVGFFGTDEKFLKWSRDLFMHYWEDAERWYPGIQIQ